MATGLEKVSFHSNPREGHAKEYSNYHTITLISHASKIILRSLQTRLQQNQEIPDIQAWFRKGRGTRDKIPNIPWSIEKQGDSSKTYISVSLTRLTPLTLWITTNCGKFLKIWEYQTTLPLLRNMYAGEETIFWTKHGTMDWFQTGQGVHQGCMLSCYLFNLYAEYIMWKARLDEAQAGIKIARRNINNLRYADATTLMAENKEELKRLLIKVKEDSEKVGLKLSIQKTKIMASGPITSWQIDRKTMETVTNFIFLGSKITADGDFSHEIRRCLLLGSKALTNLVRISNSKDITLLRNVWKLWFFQ